MFSYTWCVRNKVLKRINCLYTCYTCIVYSSILCNMIINCEINDCSSRVFVLLVVLGHLGHHGDQILVTYIIYSVQYWPLMWPSMGSPHQISLFIRSPESLRWPIAMSCRPSCVNIFFSRTTGPILTNIKQEAHEPHCSAEKPVQINEYICYIYSKTGPVVQEEKIFKFCESTFAILLLSLM